MRMTALRCGHADLLRPVCYPGLSMSSRYAAVDVRLGDPAHLGGQQPRGASAWSGASSGHGIGLAVTALLPDIFRERRCREISARLQPAHRAMRATSFIPTCRPRIFGLNVATSRSSARGKCPIRNWKPRFGELTPTFCVLLHRSTRPIRKTIWSMRAGFPLADGVPWSCCRTGIPMRSLTPDSAAY